MIRSLTNPAISGAISIAIFAVSIYFAYVKCDSGLVASAGAMLSLFGIFLTTRVILRHKSVDDIYQSQNLDIRSLPSLQAEGVIDPENDKKIEKQKEEKQEKKKDIVAQKYGVWFLFIGTVIWAYGDRLFNIVCVCCK